MTFLQTFLLMLGAHALADYPLQGDFLARAKNHRAPLPGVPWYQALTAHAMIQGTFVGLITGSIVFGLAETVMHAFIDFLKCEKVIDYDIDQFLHVVCKAVWCVLLFGATA